MYGFGPAARSILPLQGHPDARGLGPYTVLQEARTAQGRTAERRGRGCPESLDRLGARKEEGGAKTEQTQVGQAGGQQAGGGRRELSGGQRLGLHCGQGTGQLLF